jgi:surfactin synthase thioesterase subunit
MTWLRTHRPRPNAACRLICFSHGGGSAALYRDWLQDVPGIEVRAVQYPGRGDRVDEPLIDDLRTLARRTAEEIAALTDRPVALFGHSLGAVVAYEVAREVANDPVDGLAVRALFVSGSDAPHCLSPDRVSTLDDDDLIAAVERLGDTPPEVLADPSMRELMLPIVRADHRAIENHVHRRGSPLSCPIVCLVARSDPLVTTARAGRWRELTDGPFALHVFPGDHFYLRTHRVDSLVQAYLEGGVPQ